DFHVTGVQTCALPISNGSFLFINIQLHHAFCGIADKSFGRNKFGKNHIGALLFAKRAEWRVTNVLHWGEQQRKIRQLYVSYFWQFFLFGTAKVVNINKIKWTVSILVN